MPSSMPNYMGGSAKVNMTQSVATERLFRAPILVGLPLILLACGGGSPTNIEPVPNQPPVITAIADQTVVTPNGLNFEVSATDPDGPPPLALSVNGLPNGASFVDNLDGTGMFNWTPTNEDTLASPFAVAFNAIDGGGSTATENVLIIVRGTQPPIVQENQPPILAPLDDRRIAIGETVTFDVTATDPDGPPPLTITAAGVPPAAEFTNNLDGTGTFTWTPTIGDIASSPYRVTFTATDADDTSLTDTVTADLHVSLTDEFNSGDVGWRFVDNVPDRSGSWEAVEGALLQRNFVERLKVSFDGSYHLGTYAYLAAGLALTNYRFSVDAVSQDTENAEDIGVMFRYQDNDNYYRLSVNGKYGFTRLEKKINGVFSPLAVDGRGNIHGQSIRFTIEVNGNRIQTWVNGEPKFAVEDDALLTGTIALYTQDRSAFDNVAITGPAVPPSITIATPVAHTVSASTLLQATAIAPRISPESKAEFRLGSAPPITDDTPPFQATFPSLAAGDYVLEVILRDSDGQELTRDRNERIGVSGEYFIAIGDSNTNGYGDRYSRDNRSVSGRILAKQGYQANLVDLLDASLQRPVIVYNAGFSGDRSSDAVQRVDSVLARHAGSNKALVMLGTNDSNSGVPSGSGCSGTTCDGTFKGNMTTIVKKLRDAGNSVYVAHLPPAFGNRTSGDPASDPLALTRNRTIQAYNSVIANELEDISQGPDFFSFFLTNTLNRFSLFDDLLHPNSLGYVVIAHLWQNVIDPSAPVPLPFILENLSPSTEPPYLKQNLLEIGNTYYIDRDYTLADIPEILAEGIWITTANDRANDTDLESITFDVDQSVLVFLAYDAAASALPNWMSEFVDTGLTVATTNPQTPTFNVYRRAYTAGRITLGGNMADGAVGADSNYVVIINPLEEG